MVGALEGIKALDLTRLLPGAYCSGLLADFGAEVLKVEDTGEGDYMRILPPLLKGYNPAFLNLNRNKKSIALDLKKERGREIFYQLARQADVLLEGFRPGVTERLGIDYEKIRAVNPRIIYCSLSGYGQNGPYRDRVGHDLNYIGIGGILGLTKQKGQKPTIPGTQVGDLGGGALMATVGVLIALLARERTGEGQYVDVAMLDGIVSWLTMGAAQQLNFGELLPEGRVVYGDFACYQVYETKDGKYLTVGAIEEKFWATLCSRLGKEEWIPLQNIPEKQEEIIKEIGAIFLTKTQKEWLEFFEGAEVCLGPVHTLPEVFEDPQVQAREMVTEGIHPNGSSYKQLSPPLKLSATPGTIRSPAPAHGQHTEEVLRELGYSSAEITTLRDAGVVK